MKRLSVVRVQESGAARIENLGHLPFVAVVSTSWYVLCMTEQVPQHRRWSQFSLRRMLLWTTVVALGFSGLFALVPNTLGRVLLAGWFVTVFILRRAFGSGWAASLSILVGMLPFAQLLCSIWMTDDWSLKHSLVEGWLGGLIGFALFLLVEAACRTVDWIDGMSGEL